MSSLRGAVQAVAAVAFVGLLAVALRVFAALQAEAQRVGGVAQARLLVLVLAGVGLLIAAFTLWAARHVVAAAAAAALLTVVLVVQGPFRLFAPPQQVVDAWWTLGLGSNTTVVPLAWGATLAALAVAVAGRRGRRRARRAM